MNWQQRMWVASILIGLCGRNIQSSPDTDPDPSPTDPVMTIWFMCVQSEVAVEWAAIEFIINPLIDLIKLTGKCNHRLIIYETPTQLNSKWFNLLPFINSTGMWTSYSLLHCVCCCCRCAALFVVQIIWTTGLNPRWWRESGIHPQRDICFRRGMVGFHLNINILLIFCRTCVSRVWSTTICSSISGHKAHE